MTPEQIDQVFGRGRLKMVTGEHVEVFREAIAPGERRRYTKRFLATSDGDFGPWTEREWRILARLIGHGIRCVPDVVHFDGGATGGARLVQTYDAGVTVDQWATLLPVARGDAVRRHVFEDCAHWWALAYHCLSALDEIHALGLVHLDIKADNICVPCDPADFDPDSPGMRLYPMFTRLALIDFAFALVSREPLATPLPIGWQKDYDYQSPRLLRALEAGRQGDLEPTRELDWRCDIYSLAAMLKRYLPAAERANAEDGDAGWTLQLYDDARTLIFRLRESHDRELPDWRPHRQLMDFAVARMEENELVASLARGWTLARFSAATEFATPMTPITPMTRIARPVRVVAPRRTTSPIAMRTAVTVVSSPERAEAGPRAYSGADPAAIEAARRTAQRRRPRTARVLITVIVVLAAAMVPSLIGDRGGALDLVATLRSMFGETAPKSTGASRASSMSAPSWQVDARPSAAAPPAAEAVTAVPSPPVVATAPAAIATSEPGLATATTPDDGERTATSPPAAMPERAADASPAAEPGEAAGRDAASAGTTGAKAAAPRATVRGKSSAASERSPGKSRPAEIKREPAARRSPAASTIAGRSPVAPSSTHPGVSRRSDARMIASPRAPAPQSTPPTQIATAPSLEPGAPSDAQVPTTAPEAGTAGANPRDPSSSVTAVAPASAPATATATPGPAGTTNDDRGAPAEAGSGAVAEARPPPQAATAKSQRSVPRAPPRDDWRTQLASFFGLVRKSDVPPAPIEERGVSSTVARHGGPPTPRVPPRPAPAPTPESPGPAVVERIGPSPAPRPLPVAPMVALAQPNPIPDAVIGAPPPRGSSSLPVRSADDSADVLAVHGRRLLVETVPRVAAQAQPEVSRVLRAASLAGHPSQAQSVVDAAYGPWASDGALIPASGVSPTYARRLHDDARLAGASGRNLSEAIDLGLRAFGANPRDPDIASHLATLHLRKRPGQPEIARQLVLHAIAVSGPRRSTRSEDWGTLAVASAMTGRETDAVRAYLVELALTSDVDRSCKAALNAYATFGDRLRVPVSAMLSRARSQARGYEYPSCAWPSSWTTTVARLPTAF